MEDKSIESVETTDSWEWGKIIKHVFLPKPKGSPKAGKKEIGARIGIGAICGLLVFSLFSSSGVPACGDSETTDLVTQIADREMENQLGVNAAKMFSYQVNAIRTINTNKQTGAFECAAQLGITASNTGNTSEIPITYTVELTDKGDEFYVNVFGL